MKYVYGGMLAALLLWIGFVFADEDIFRHYGAVSAFSVGLAACSECGKRCHHRAMPSRIGRSSANWPSD